MFFITALKLNFTLKNEITKNKEYKMSKSFSIFTAFKAKDGMTPAFRNMTQGMNTFSQRVSLTNSKLKNFGSCVQNTCGKINTLVNATLGFVAFDTVKDKFNSFVDSASDLQETVGKTTEVFKANSQEVLNWSKTSIKSMGLAEQTALDTASLYGDMATGMGLGTKRAGEMSMSLTKLSADLASFKNVSQDISANALKGIFTGETESLKNLGVVMTETTLQEYALANGIRKKLKDMSQAEKIELRYQYVMKSTVNSQGDFQRTFANFANQKRINAELKKQGEINFGKIMLPTYNRTMVAFNTLLTNNMDKMTRAFERAFNLIVSAIKKFKPVFNELKITFRIFSEQIAPQWAELAPLFKGVFENVLIPALTLTVAAVNKLMLVFKGVYNFLKATWIPIVGVLAGVGGMLALKTAFDAVTAAITWYNTALMVSTKNGIAVLTGFSKLKFMLTTFTGAMWKSVAAIWAQTVALWANPWTWVAAGIALVVAGAILVWKNWDKITAAFGRFWQACKDVFAKFKTFFRNNFLDCILVALGPIGWLIAGVRKLGQAVAGLGKNKKGNEGGIDYDDPSNSPQVNGGGINTRYNQGGGNNTFSGKLDVGVSIDNSTMFPATSSLNLTGNHNLNLVPAG